MQNPHKSKSVVNPQAENGHRRINNDVYHALSMYPFTGAELRVVLATIDRTWGWDLKSATISLNKFMLATNLSRQGVVKAIKGLSKKRVLVIKHGKAPKQSEYLFNKHFDTWLDSQPALSILIPQPETKQLPFDGQPQLPIKKGDSQPQLPKDSQPQLPIKKGDSQPQLPKDSQPQLPMIVNQGLLLIVNWPSLALSLLQQRLQQYFTTTNTNVGPLKPEALEGLIKKQLLNQLRAKVFELLKEKRGYNSPQTGAEAKAITWMLRQDYSVEDIMDAYQIMSEKPFWKDKELLMPSLQGQIGKIKKGGQGGAHSGDTGTSVEQLKKSADKSQPID
ncbi:hypothetical protein LCGC14_1172370 [marine sediment metagenome]|uniref:Bacteriophage lambda Replication protein O N-terminal domain-containing protein n=1 Tax=marine sediment metagenome TaxID=412755 RepID=A0A0F9LUC7_9ZZZZ